MQQHKVLPVCIWGCKGLMVLVLISCVVPVLLCPSKLCPSKHAFKASPTPCMKQHCSTAVCWVPNKDNCCTWLRGGATAGNAWSGAGRPHKYTIRGLFTLRNGSESFTPKVLVVTKPTFFLLHSGDDVFVGRLPDLCAHGEGFSITRGGSVGIAARWTTSNGQVKCAFGYSDWIFCFNSAKVSLGWLRLSSTCQWPPAAAKSQVWDGKHAVLPALNIPMATCGVS